MSIYCPEQHQSEKYLNGVVHSLHQVSQGHQLWVGACQLQRMQDMSEAVGRGWPEVCHRQPPLMVSGDLQIGVILLPVTEFCSSLSPLRFWLRAR